MRKSIKKMKKTRIIGYLILIIVLFASISLSVLFSLVSTSLLSTIKTVRIPDTFIITDLDPVDPRFNLSFSISNRGVTEIKGFYVEISEVLVYSNKYNNSPEEIIVFQKKSNFKSIPSGKTLNGFFSGDETDYLLDNLNIFWDSVNVTIGYYEILNIVVGGRFFFGLVPFKLSIESFCITCIG